MKYLIIFVTLCFISCTQERSDIDLYLVNKYFIENLKDPNTIKNISIIIYNIDSISFIKDKLIYIEYNAKNSFGGYVGINRGFYYYYNCQLYRVKDLSLETKCVIKALQNSSQSRRYNTIDYYNYIN